jgi:hypothetical protein
LCRCRELARSHAIQPLICSHSCLNECRHKPRHRNWHQLYVTVI